LYSGNGSLDLAGGVDDRVRGVDDFPEQARRRGFLNVIAVDPAALVLSALDRFAKPSPRVDRTP
jgi:hypothetical protein